MSKAIAVHILSRSAKPCYWSDLTLADVRKRIALEESMGIETRMLYIQDELLGDRKVTHVFLEQPAANPHWLRTVKQDFPKAKILWRLHPGADSPRPAGMFLNRWRAPKAHRQMARACDVTLGLSDTETHRYWRTLVDKDDPFQTVSLPQLGLGTGSHGKRALAVADGCFLGGSDSKLADRLRSELATRFDSMEPISKAWLLGEYQGLALLDPKSRGHLSEVMRRVQEKLPVWLTYPLYDELPLELKGFCQPLSEDPSREEIVAGLRVETLETAYRPTDELEARVRTALSWIFQ